MRKVLSKDGTPIAFDQSGQGPALILVTGAIAKRTDAASLSAALSPHFTVFAYDRRGRGESGDTPPYAVEREVEDIDVLITEAGGAAFVFGHSSGAVLALEAARLLPTRITKLTVYEPPFIIDDSRPPMPENSAQHLTELVSSGRRGDAVEYFMTQVGTPAEAIAHVAGVRGGGEHARVRHDHRRRHREGRPAAAQEVGVGDGPHARDGRYGVPWS